MAVRPRQASLNIPGSADLLGFSCIRVVRFTTNGTKKKNVSGNCGGKWLAGMRWKHVGITCLLVGIVDFIAALTLTPLTTEPLES